METKTYHVMEYSELDDLINKCFPGINFEFVAAEELDNDTDKDFGLRTKDNYQKWSEYDKKDFDKIIIEHSSWMWRTRLFLDYLVAMDLLPEGNYLITVSW